MQFSYYILSMTFAPGWMDGCRYLQCDYDDVAVFFY